MKRFKGLLLRMPLLLIPLYFVLRILHGYAVYRRLCRRYGENVELYSAFLPSTGEPFFAAAAFRWVVAQDGTEERARFVVIGDTQHQIARWFGISEPIVLAVRASNNLLRMYRFLCGTPQLRFHILHYEPSQMYVRIAEDMLSFRGLNFLTMLREVAFGGIPLSELDIPKGEKPDEALTGAWKHLGLQADRTVVLAPYAVSVTPLPMAFWARLAENLKELGFIVCTNCAGHRERPVPGTISLTLPYCSMLAFLEWAGYLIGLRSGLADITCLAVCRRILLYPKENYLTWGVGSPLACFSLANMGVCRNAVELEYGEKNVDSLLNQIAEVVGTWAVN